jgi:hypothetical protein
MADVPITIANIEIRPTSSISRVVCGELCTGGQFVYNDELSTPKHWLAVNATEAQSKATGVIITPNTEVDGVAEMVALGGVVIGGVLAPGVIYYVSSTAGAIFLASDLLSTHWVNAVGIAADAEELSLGTFAGVQLP